MLLKKNHRKSRRNFLLQCSGIFAGLLAPLPNAAADSRKDVKDLLRRIETESIREARPVRNAETGFCQRAGKNREIHSGNESAPAPWEFNPTAACIWQACDGSNTPPDIARRLCTRFAVAYPQAYADTLRFLRELKNRDLIHLI